MENTQDPFDSIFEGIDLPEDFAAKLKTAFDSVVAQKVQEATTKGIMNTTGLTELDPQELKKDIDIKKILAALKISPDKFAFSLRSAMQDIERNTIADDSFNAMLELLSAIADDSVVAARLSTALRKDMETAKSSEEPAATEPAATEPADNMKQVNAELEVYENVVNSVDKYLTYVAESWLEDNTLAVEQGLKIEIMESFWSGLKTMFVEHNIVIPEETNVVEDLKTKIADLQSTISEEKTAFVVKLTKQKQQFEEKLNEEINKSIVYKNRAETSSKKVIFESVSKDLTLTQKERFAKLSESVTYESKKSYEEKLKDIVKNAFESTKTKKKLTEDSMISVSDDTQIIADDPIINLYSQAISNNLKF